MKRTVFVVFFLLNSCATNSQKQKAAISDDRARVRERLTGEISLKSDRQKLDDLRKKEPEDKKVANDELAFFLTQTGELKQDPNVVRERFQLLVQKKRSRFNEAVDRLRKEYAEDERKRRDDFNTDRNSKRDAYMKKQHPPTDETRAFYSQMEKDRLDFYSRERDRRKDFDDEIQTQQKEFSAYIKERTDEFNEQMRLYKKRYDEAAKQKAAQPSVPPAPPAQGR